MSRCYRVHSYICIQEMGNEENEEIWVLLSIGYVHVVHLATSRSWMRILYVGIQLEGSHFQDPLIEVDQQGKKKKKKTKFSEFSFLFPIHEIGAIQNVL